MHQIGPQHVFMWADHSLKVHTIVAPEKGTLFYIKYLSYTLTQMRVLHEIFIPGKGVRKNWGTLLTRCTSCRGILFLRPLPSVIVLHGDVLRSVKNLSNRQKGSGLAIDSVDDVGKMEKIIFWVNSAFICVSWILVVGVQRKKCNSSF